MSLDKEWLGLFEELIDTLWNVNPFPSGINPEESRINRYIMECKSTQTRRGKLLLRN